MSILVLSLLLQTFLTINMSSNLILHNKKVNLNNMVSRQTDVLTYCDILRPSVLIICLICLSVLQMLPLWLDRSGKKGSMNIPLVLAQSET